VSKLSSTTASLSKHSYLPDNPFALQLRKDRLSTRDSNLFRALLILRICDLTMIKHHSPTPTIHNLAHHPHIPITQTYFLSPIPAGQPYSLLKNVFVSLRNKISSSLTPLTFPHAFITQLSLLAITATTSTPFSANFSRWLMYGGRWWAWQPGVKAPGTEKRTTFLSAHSLEALYSCGRPQAVGSASVMGAHLHLVSVY